MYLSGTSAKPKTSLRRPPGSRPARRAKAGGAINLSNEITSLATQANAGGAGKKPSGWLDLAQGALVYLQQRDADKRAQQMRAAGQDVQVVPKGDGTFVIEETPFYKKPLVIGGLALGGLALIFALSRARSNPPRRRRRARR